MADQQPPRSKRDRIERLRTRVQTMSQNDPSTIVLAGILKAILDLLADEL